MVRRVPSLLLVISLFFPLLAHAQAASTLSARGRVIDPADRPVPGATVVLRSAAGFIRRTATGPDGAFEFADIAPGDYDVMATVDGFRADPVHGTTAGGSLTQIVITLRLSGITDTVVVSAAQVEMPLSQASANVTTLRSADLRDHQMTTVAEALALVPGFTVAPTGGAGSLTSLFPRGGGSDYTLVMADGIRLNSMGGGFDFGHLSTAGLEQLEVVRGPQSAVFGADAIGGVIQLQSKLGGRPALAAEVETGGYGTNRLTLGTTGSLGAVGWGASVERRSSQGWTDVAPGATDHVSNDDDQSTAVTLVSEVKVSRDGTLRASGRFESNDRGYPGPFGSNPIGAYGGIDRISRGRNDNAGGAITFTQAWGANSVIRAQGSYADLESKFASPWGDSTARTRRWTALAQVDRSFSPNVGLSAGLDLNGERGESTYITGTEGQAIPVSRRDAAVFAEARVRTGDRLTITGGVRADYIERAALEADPLAWMPRPGMPADNLLSVNPRVAAGYFLRTAADSAGGWTRVHGSAGTGIRPPGSLEIAFTDNPGLKPERNTSIDAGLERALWNGRLVLDATAFANRYTDLIVAVGRSLTDYSQFRTDNISNARAYGVETSAAVRTTSGVQVRATYTWLDTAVLAVDRSNNLAPPPFTVGDPLLRRPRHQGMVDVVWKHRAVTVFGRVDARGSVLDVEPSLGAFGGLFTAPGYVVADTGVTARLAHGLDLLARVDNLFNRSYEAVYGYPAPGRTVTIGVRVAAGR